MIGINRVRSVVRRLRQAYSIAREYPYPLVEWLASYSDQLGGTLSFERRRPISTTGEHLPWMTYPAIEYFSQLDLSNKFVFEYGSGNGSVFWAGRARKVVSVEDNPEWIEELRSVTKPNHEIILAASAEDYINSINGIDERPDIVIVDGSHRRDCAIAAVSAVSDSGMIVLDNSDWCPEACAILNVAGFQQFDFIGTGPINLYSWSTSVFVRLAKAGAFPRITAVPTVTGGLKQTFVNA